MLGGLLLTSAVVPANADAWNKKTYVTTSQAIEVPGAVLPPGKYVFKLMESPSNRHIVQIMNAEENHVYTTNLAIAKERMDPADKTVLTFYEMPGGGPEPVRSWFYPGDTIGQEFAYPKDRAREISQTVKQSVPELAESRPPAAAPALPAETPAPVAEPNNGTADRVAPTETEEAAAAEPPPPPVASEPQPPPAQEPATPTDSTPAEPAMPQTAGNTAAIGLLGLGCLGIAASIRMALSRAGSKS
jgi:cell division septation protein DedD